MRYHTIQGKYIRIILKTGEGLIWGVKMESAAIIEPSIKYESGVQVTLIRYS